MEQIEEANYSDSRTDEQKAEDAKNPPTVTSTEPSEVDKWAERALEVDNTGDYVLTSEQVARQFNAINLRRRQMDTLEAIKFRARYGVPKATCHKMGQKFTRGSGRKKTQYVVGFDGAWRKVV